MTTVTLNANNDNVSAMYVEKNGELTLKDIDYVCGANHIAYGVYLCGSGRGTQSEMEQHKDKSATLNMESGSITTRDCSCVATNGNDLSKKNYINISGSSKLLNENSYGIYMPAYGEINISGGEVQGINMRRGTLNITGGRILKPNNTVEAGPLKADPIGEYTNYSGLIWLGRTIAVLSGSKGYIKENNEEINITISDSALLNDSFDGTAPIHVYCLDTSDADKNQVVNITISDPSKVKVWTHEDIEDDVAFCHGPNYVHKSFSTVYINGEKVYGPEEE